MPISESPVSESISRSQMLWGFLKEAGSAIGISVLLMAIVPGFLLHISLGYLFLIVWVLFVPPYVGGVLWFCGRWMPPFRVVWFLLLLLASLAGAGFILRVACESLIPDGITDGAIFYWIAAAGAAGTWIGPVVLTLLLITLLPVARSPGGPTGCDWKTRGQHASP